MIRSLLLAVLCMAIPAFASEAKKAVIAKKPAVKADPRYKGQSPQKKESKQHRPATTAAVYDPDLSDDEFDSRPLLGKSGEGKEVSSAYESLVAPQPATTAVQPVAPSKLDLETAVNQVEPAALIQLLKGRLQTPEQILRASELIHLIKDENKRNEVFDAVFPHRAHPPVTDDSDEEKDEEEGNKSLLRANWGQESVRDKEEREYYEGVDRALDGLVATGFGDEGLAPQYRSMEGTRADHIQDPRSGGVYYPGPRKPEQKK